MIRRSVRVLILGLIAATTACADPPTPVTPTTPTILEEPPWTGTLTINGGQTLPFNVLATGQITATIFSLSPNPDNSVRVGLALGLWSGQACSLQITNDSAFQTSVIYGSATTAGAFCVRISDAGHGGMTEPVDFDIRVTHP